MIITCPYCGPRDLSEFSYQGDATRTRPDPASTDEVAWHAWVYERPNPAGWHREFWQHSGGCRAHLVVTRNTLTHEIGEVVLVCDARAAGSAAVEAPAKKRRAPARPKAAESKSAKSKATKPRTPRRGSGLNGASR